MRILRASGRIVAVAAIVVTYFGARLPSTDTADVGDVALRFTERAIPDPPGPLRGIRHVHPSLAHIVSWVSAVGAGIALADLDGDGLPNDACHVDPRVDEVTVRPVPGSGRSS